MKFLFYESINTCNHCDANQFTNTFARTFNASAWAGLLVCWSWMSWQVDATLLWVESKTSHAGYSNIWFCGRKNERKSEAERRTCATRDCYWWCSSGLRGSESKRMNTGILLTNFHFHRFTEFKHKCANKVLVRLIFGCWQVLYLAFPVNLPPTLI